MKFRLSSEITKKIPGFSVATIVIKNVNNLRKSSAVSQLLTGVCAAKKSELSNEAKKQKRLSFLKQAAFDHQILKEAQFLESLLGKATKGEGIQFKENLTGLISFLALKYLVPLYASDLDEIEKDRELNFIASKASAKAQDMKFSKDTKNLVVWLVDIGSHTKEQFAQLPEECIKTIKKYCGGEAETVQFLNADLMEIDLDYISEKERQYTLEQQKKAEQEAAAAKILSSDEPPFLDATNTPIVPERSLKDILEEELASVVKNLEELKDREDKEELGRIKLEVPHDPLHGDYASSIGLKLGKILQKNPMEVAETLKKKFPLHPSIDRVEVVAPGFINFHLSSAYLEKELKKVLSARSNYGRLAIGNGQKMMIEYSQPNIAKPLGVHHLLSTIIGQTLVNLYRFSGFEVIATNYPGDWGTQFGKLLYAYKTWGNEEVVKNDPLNELLKLYVQFHNEAEKDPTLDDKGRAEFKKLEEGDEENRKLWQWMKDLSIQEIERLYKKLGVHFDLYLGEEMHREEAKKLIQEGQEKHIIEVGEKGALIVTFENEKLPPYVVQKSDGTTLYSSRDIASINYRIQNYHPNKIIYVVDVAQSLHFQQLFETVKKFGFTEPELMHVNFGRMQFPEGRMSTRKGEVVLLDEVIKEAVSRTEKLVEEKSKDLPLEEKKQVAEAMAISAIKYNIISQNRETNMVFEWDRMLSLDGNSAPYMQYAYARAKSILRKAREPFLKNETNETPKPKAGKDDLQASLFSMVEKKVEQEPSNEPSKNESAKSDTPAIEAPVVNQDEDKKRQPFEHPSEKTLLRLLPHFPEKIELAVVENKPNVLTTYLFELARAFSSFYNEMPVLHAGTDELKKSRLELVEAVSQVLKNGLNVLGIVSFERM